MRLREIRKRFAVLGASAVIAVSGSAMYVLAAPEGNTSVQELKTISVDDVENHAAGALAPTVFADAYRAPKTKRYSRAVYPEKYDLRELGQTTTVKNQGVWGTCWAFATIASLESCQLKNEGASGNVESNTPDFSELQLGWFNYEPQSAKSLEGSAAGAAQVGEGVSMGVGSERLEAGGNMPQAVTLLSTWQGGADEKDIPYHNAEGGTGKEGNWAVDDSKRNLSAIHLQNADFMPSPTTKISEEEYTYDKEAEKAMKNALMNNGAVAISYYADQSMQGVQGNGDYFNYTNWCQYVDVLNQSTTPNHSVTIVGWDDTYSRANFRQDRRPEGDGAWLVKNSWGTGYWGVDNSGYFWLSYYDRTISQVTSYQGEPSDNYDNNYQYDYLGLASAIQYMPGGEISIANVFTANTAEALRAVSAITSAPETTVTVKIYKLPSDAKGPLPENGGELVATVSKKFTYSGYHTIELDTPRHLDKGDKFSVVETIRDSEGKYYYPVEIGADHSGKTTQKAVCNPGESYWVYSNNTYSDMSSATSQGSTYGNAMIKAFTDNLPPDIPTLSEITYSPARTLGDVSLPSVEGGIWAWDSPNTIPRADQDSYPATFTPEDESSPYGVFHTDIPLKVNKATPRISGVSSSSIMYGQRLLEAVLQGNASVDGVSVRGTLSWISGETCPEVSDSEKTVYDYQFIPEDQINYNTAAGKVSLVVEKKPVTVRAKDAEKIYGDENPSFELESIPQGILAGNDTADDLEIQLFCGADERTPVGSADISGVSGAVNYDVTVMPGELIVNRREADFKVLDTSIRFGEGLPESYAYEVTNLAYWDDEQTLGAKLFITPKDIPVGNPSGIYTLEIERAVIANENYKAGKMVSGNLTIREVTTPPLPDMDEIIYNPNKALGEINIPEVEGGRWTWDEPDEIPTVNKKTYAAIFTPHEESDYRASREDIPLTVKKAVPHVAEVNPGAITYGDSLAESGLTAVCQVDGIQVPGEASWLTAEYRPTVADSGKTIFAFRFTPSDQENYEMTAGETAVAVEAKQIVVKVKNASKTYGDANPVFEMEVPENELVEGDSVADLALRLNCSADQRTPAGDVLIQGESGALNYAVEVNPGVLTINRRPLHFKAVNVSVKYEEALPGTYDFEVSNLVNGASKASVGATASIEAVNMQASKKSGTYTLKIRNASVSDANYMVGSITDGTLTIAAAGQETKDPGKIVEASTVKVSAATVKDKTIRLSWIQVPEAEGYQVQLKISGKWKVVKTIGKNSTTSYNYNKTKLGRSYVFRVRAFRRVSGKTIYSKAGQVKEKAVPQVPAGLKATGKKGKITLTWKKISGVSGYTVSRKAGGGWKTVSIFKASKKSFIDRKVKKGKTYTYRIRAYKVSKGKKVYGSYSEAVKVKASR